MLRRRNKEEQPGDDAPAGEEELELVIETELDEATKQVFDTLQDRLREAEDGRKRAMADFVNFQRRAAESERVARREGINSVVRSLLPVLDNLDLALGHELETASLETVMQGVEMLKHQILDAMANLNVQRIAPEPGDAFDPTLHQAVAQQPSDELEPGRVFVMVQAGFRVQDMVLRPASVVVVAADAGHVAPDPDADADAETRDDEPPPVHDISDVGEGDIDDEIEKLYGDDES